MENVCVYLLRDPRDNIARYVGITSSPKTRLRQHWHNRTHLCSYYASNGNKLRGDWFGDMELHGVKPVMDVLFSGLTKAQALRVESHILQRTIEADPSRMKQHSMRAKDPVRVVREAWSEAGTKQRELICKFVTQQMASAS